MSESELMKLARAAAARVASLSAEKQDQLRRIVTRPLRVLVTGGRSYNNRSAVWGALDALRQRHGALLIIQGGATGADQLAREWCAIQRYNLIDEPADWRTYGRAAGPIRNQKMLDKHKPDLVLVFPGGRGTADMVRRVKTVGIKVIEIEGAA